MSINAIVNGTAYEDVNTIVVGDKNVVLKQVQESSGAVNPWEGSLANSGSIGYILNACENATATGTVEGGRTVSFDTGLGTNIKHLVILDESASAFPTMNASAIEGIYFLNYDFEHSMGTTIYSSKSGGNIRAKTEFAKRCFPRASSISFDNGVFEYVPSYNGNELYNNFTPNHTYRWFAW